MADRSNRLTIAEARTRAPGKSALPDRDIEDAVREYVRTYVLWRGRRRAAEDFGVSRHTLWRFLRRGHMGRTLPRAVMDMAGDSVETLEAAAWAIAATERLRTRRPAPKAAASARSLSEALEDTLLLLCAAPLATVDELSRFGRIPASTLRDRLKRLAKMGMADSVSHHLGILGPHPQRRHFPTERGIVAGGGIEHGTVAAPPAVTPFSVGKYRRCGRVPRTPRWCGTESTRPRSVSFFNRSRSVEAGTRPKRDSSSTVAKGVAQSDRRTSSRPWRRRRSAGSGRRPSRSMMISSVAASIARTLPPTEFRTAEGTMRPVWPRSRNRQRVWRDTPRSSAVFLRPCRRT